MIVTFDTNILVYATAQASVANTHRAQDIIDRGIKAGAAILLLQALIEFSNVAIRKAGMPLADVRTAVEAWRSDMRVEYAVPEDLAAALDATQRHKLHFWDALLWSTARRAGVRYLLSEDFQDGRLLGGVRFVNPFRSPNDALIDRILPRT